MIEHQRTIVCFRMLPIENYIKSYKVENHLNRMTDSDVFILHMYWLLDMNCITFLMILYLKAHRCN